MFTAPPNPSLTHEPVSCGPVIAPLCAAVCAHTARIFCSPRSLLSTNRRKVFSNRRRLLPLKSSFNAGLYTDNVSGLVPCSSKAPSDSHGHLSVLSPLLGSVQTPFILFKGSVRGAWGGGLLSLWTGFVVCARQESLQNKQKKSLLCSKWSCGVCAADTDPW